MGNTETHCALVVACLSLIALSNCNAFSEDLETNEKCINIKKCEPVMRLLRIQMIKKKIYREVRQAFCGFEGRDFKIYCDVQKIIHRPERFERVIAAHSVNYMTTNTPPPVDPLLTSIDKHPNYRLLEHDICGPVPLNYRNQVNTRIIGGRITDRDEFPWMALLAYEEENYDGEPQFRCGATVINRNHVMTAAHCVTSLGPFKLVSVRIGEHDLSTEEDCDDDHQKCNAKYEDFGIDQIYPHSDYSTETLQNDIAIIRLNGSIDFTRTQVRPICLPIEPEQIKPTRGIVTGWGSKKHDSLGSKMLHKIYLPIQSIKQCQDAYSNVASHIKIWHKQFCAGGIRGMDSCTGDSGGPFQMITNYRGSIRIVQRGIVSFGKKTCGVEDSPGVYTSLMYYIRWILDTIR